MNEKGDRDDLAEEINELLRDPELGESIKRQAEEVGVAPFDYVLNLALRDVAGAKERSAIRSLAMAAADGLTSFPSKEVVLGSYPFKLYGIAADDAYFSSINPNTDIEFYALCRRLISPDYVCLDVGANIGIKSLFLSRHCRLGKVIAIEPAATVARCLEANIATNGLTNVLIERAAVSETRGFSRFVDSSAWGHLSQSGAEVRVTTLEEIVGRLGLARVDFIKIDTEGAEFSIMRSSLDLINRFESLVLVELNSWTQLALANVNPRDFIDWVLAQVFALHRGDPGRDLLEPIRKEEGLALLHRNLVRDGSVTDLLVTNTERRLVPSPAYLEEQLKVSISRNANLYEELNSAIAERDAAIAERNAATAECKNLRESGSWRVTAPLRWLRDRMQTSK